jgi:peptide-methionine (S)-S-oxide reductase
MAKIESIVLGGGCFWCLDAAYRMMNGVTRVVSGYAGGRIENPSYEAVCGGQTGHAEVVEVSFDTTIISPRDILETFFFLHDPTTINRQGNDIGEQYRSVIFYQNEDQREMAQTVIENFAAKLWEKPIVTQILPLKRFWPAEEYHQNFFIKNPSQAYCQVIINPKLQKFRSRYEALLK